MSLSVGSRKKQSKKSFDELILELRTSNSEKVRYNAARVLGEMGDLRAVETLVDVLKNDKNGSVRLYAARALGELGDSTATIPLIESLREDRNVDVRVRAARALTQKHGNHQLVKEIEKRKEGQLQVDSETRYLETMTALNSRLTTRKLYKSVTAVTMGAFMIGAALTGGMLSTILFGAGVATGIIGGAVEGATIGGIHEKLFDEYYQLDSIFEEGYDDFAISKGLQVSDLTDKEKGKIKETIRQKIITELGYSSISDAATVICTQFAYHISEKLKNPKDANYEMYVKFVHSLGLAINAKKGEPTVGNLTRKLTGR